MLEELGFVRRKSVLTEQEIVENLQEIYPAGEYPQVSEIKEQNPELYKAITTFSKSTGETVMHFLSRYGFRKAAPKIHSNSLEQPWDRKTLKRLYYEYDVTFEQLASIFGCSKQTISLNINNKKDTVNTGGWISPLTNEEFSDAEHVIREGETMSSNEYRSILVLSGRRDRRIMAVLYKNVGSIACIFDAEHVFSDAFARRKKRFAGSDATDLLAEIENVWIKQGRVTLGHARMFQCTATMLNKIRNQADEQGLSIAEFLGNNGYAITDNNSVTKDRLSNYIIPGTENTVSISTKDVFYRTLSTAARRKGFSGIKEYVESFGFIYKSGRHDSSIAFRTVTVTSSEAIQRTIDRIKPYVIPGTNTVKIDTSSPDYKYLVFTANSRGFSSFKAMLEEYGFYYESKRGKRSSLDDVDYVSDILKVITERYKVDDTHVYISSYDPFYYRLNNYVRIHGKKMDEYLSEHGYRRIKKAYDLPDGYIPYDYTEDLLLKVNGSWSEEKLRDILKRLADGNTVSLNHDSYLYTILNKRAADVGISISEFINNLGFILRLTSDTPEMPEEEQSLEESAVKKELDILKNIQAEYSHIRAESIKVKRNQILVKVLKSLYKGRCQICGDNSIIPPIYNAKGERYCEVHHINPISSIRTDSDVSEIDSYRNTIVLCPFHHSYLHHQNGGGFVLENKNGKIFLDNHHGDTLEIRLNHHICCEPESDSALPEKD